MIVRIVYLIYSVWVFPSLALENWACIFCASCTYFQFILYTRTLGKVNMVLKTTVTSTETVRLMRDGERRGREMKRLN